MTWEERGMASDGVEITGPKRDRFDEVLTPEAVGLVAALHRELGGRRTELLAARAVRQQELSAGGTLDFLAATQPIRADPAWRVAAPAPGLVDRRVEITGPTDRKMTINALNSGAKVWLADFEDANTPLWENMVSGQLNLNYVPFDTLIDPETLVTAVRFIQPGSDFQRLARSLESYPHD